MRYDDEPQDTFGLLVCAFARNPAHCVYLNNHRVAGGKPWGGGKISASWRISLKDLQAALPELEISERPRTPPPEPQP